VRDYLDLSTDPAGEMKARGPNEEPDPRQQRIALRSSPVRAPLAPLPAYSRENFCSGLIGGVRGFERVVRASIWLRIGRHRERPQAAFLSLRMMMKSSEGGGGNA
jgi:hypothetical protein